MILTSLTFEPWGFLAGADFYIPRNSIQVIDDKIVSECKILVRTNDLQMAMAEALRDMSKFRDLDLNFIERVQYSNHGLPFIGNDSAPVEFIVTIIIKNEGELSLEYDRLSKKASGHVF